MYVLMSRQAEDDMYIEEERFCGKKKFNMQVIRESSRKFLDLVDSHRFSSVTGMMYNRGCEGESSGRTVFHWDGTV